MGCTLDMFFGNNVFQYQVCKAEIGLQFIPAASNMTSSSSKRACLGPWVMDQTLVEQLRVTCLYLFGDDALTGPWRQFFCSVLRSTMPLKGLAFDSHHFTSYIHRYDRYGYSVFRDVQRYLSEPYPAPNKKVAVPKVGV